MIHIICQNIDKRTSNKCSDFVLDGVADNIHDCNYISDAFINSLTEEDIVIFMFNEDGMNVSGSFDSDMKKLMNIETKIKNKGITIYNHPSKHKVLGCKFRFYSRFRNDSFTPKFMEIKSAEDIDKVDFYPNIITLTVCTLGHYRVMCNTKADLLKAYELLKNTKKIVKYERICVMDYMNAYNSEYDCYVCVRFIVINNEIMDYYARPAEHWNVHTNDQVDDIMIHDGINASVDKYVMDHGSDIKNCFERCYRTLGNGFYEYDCIINDKGFFICEVGLKMYDDTARKVYNLLNYDINKFVIHERKYVDLIRYFLRTPRNKRKWNQKFLKNNDIYFDYQMTRDRKSLQNKQSNQNQEK